MENLTLLIPAKNEAFSLPLVLKEISLLKCKKLVIVDKNDYETINAIKNYDCIVHKQITSGYGNALIEGINKIDTEYLCIFNAYGSFQPKDLSKMLELNSSGNDFVFASRYLKNGGSDDEEINQVAEQTADIKIESDEEEEVVPKKVVKKRASSKKKTGGGRKKKIED